MFLKMKYSAESRHSNYIYMYIYIHTHIFTIIQLYFFFFSLLTCVDLDGGPGHCEICIPCSGDQCVGNHPH